MPVPTASAVIDASELPGHVFRLADTSTVVPLHTDEAVSGGGSILLSTLLAASTVYPPRDLQFIIADTSGRKPFQPFAALPHVAGLFDASVNPTAAVELRDTVAGLLDSRESGDDDGSRVYVVFNSAESLRAVPPLREALELIEQRGGPLGVTAVRSRV